MRDSFYFVCLAVTFVYLNSFQYWQLHVFQLAIIAGFTFFICCTARSSEVRLPVHLPYAGCSRHL